MKWNKILYGILISTNLYACSGEDELYAIPDQLTDCFAPDEDAKDPESLLRKDFYETEKSYLLFNDTLRHDKLSIAPNGKQNYFTELLDIDYRVGNDKNVVRKVYRYEYLKTFEEKESATNILKKYIIQRLPNEMKPFSWLVVKHIDSNGISYTSVSGQRAIAFATGDVLLLDENQKKDLSSKVLATTLANVIPEEELKDFYGISADDYDGWIRNPDRNMNPFNERGFIVWGLWRGEPDYSTGPSKEQDVESFLMLILSNSDQEIKTIYTDYPLVIEKAELIKKIIKKIGFNL